MKSSYSYPDSINIVTDIEFMFWQSNFSCKAKWGGKAKLKNRLYTSLSCSYHYSETTNSKALMHLGRGNSSCFLNSVWNSLRFWDLLGFGEVGVFCLVLGFFSPECSWKLKFWTNLRDVLKTNFSPTQKIFKGTMTDVHITISPRDSVHGHHPTVTPTPWRCLSIFHSSCHAVSGQPWHLTASARFPPHPSH